MNARQRMYRFIHAAARALGLDDDTRREFLAGVCGKRSCVDMSEAELRRACDELRRKGFKPVKNDPFERAKRRARLYMAAGEKGQAAMVLALWDELAALGAFRHGSHARLDTWMKRQGVAVAHPRFATPEQCNALIEPLKDWVRREHAKRRPAAGG